ncbi:MAG: SPOR domain-containing protein [Bacteroidetes bacterium]|nr:SPOR domain-containing protein [Bacteroidota bacterium]
MDNEHQLELEKFNFEKEKTNRDFKLRERELALQEQSQSNNGFKKLFTNPILLAAITAVLGLSVDMILKNQEHSLTLAENKRKQQSELLMKALDGSDITVIAMKLSLLDSLNFIDLTHEQQQAVISAYAQKAGVQPDYEVLINETNSDSTRRADSVIVPETSVNQPSVKPKPPIIAEVKPLTAPGYTILIGTDVLQNEAIAELELARKMYPDARQYQNGKFTLTVVGNFATRDQAEAELEKVRISLHRPGAYVIRNLQKRTIPGAETR